MLLHFFLHYTSSIGKSHGKYPEVPEVELLCNRLIKLPILNVHFINKEMVNIKGFFNAKTFAFKDNSGRSNRAS